MNKKLQRIRSWPDFGGHGMFRLLARNIADVALDRNRDLALDVLDKVTRGEAVDEDALNRLRGLLKLDQRSMVAGDTE